MQDYTKTMKERLEMEKKWDEKADLFNEYQRNNQSPISDQVIEHLERRGLLKGARVLDIGGGSGRYALPFAKRAREVVMTDISGKMLSHAQNNAAEESLSNIVYEKMAWEEAELEKLGWNQGFDLVFASMCPALRSKEGLEKMIAASKSYCFVNQFILDYDSVTQFLNRRLEVKKDFDPHNDRDNAARFFNELWSKNLNPQISYAVDEFSKRMSFDEVMQFVSRDYGEQARIKEVDLETLMKEYGAADGEGEILINGKTVSAMILWCVK